MIGAFRLGVIAGASSAGGAGPAPGGNPVWVSVTRTSGSGTTMNVTLPTASAGDLWLMIAVNGNSRDFSAGHPAGWTPLVNQAHSFFRLAVFYRIATGSEGATQSVTFSGNNPLPIFEIHRIAAGTFNAIDPVEAATPNTGTSNTINYPSLAPSWGNAASLWFSAASYNYSAGSTVISGYPFADGQHSEVPGGTGRARPATSRQVITAPSQSPGSASTISASVSWAATILAVQPA